MSRTSLAVLLLTLAGGAVAATTPFSAQEYPQPTRQHHRLLEAVGEWEGTMTAFMPGMPEEPVAAKETVTAVGGFWTQSRFECEFMGAPYVGTGCVGYDAEKGKYIATWIDNMSSQLAIMEGEASQDGKTITMHWRSPDPATGEMTDQRYELVATKDQYTSTFFSGADTKTMVISMKRKAGRAK